ncbi:hypothetical protein DID88_001687 [Monilinia fructigena]|uniref:RNase H type-1 domain-containing protein n=1 Tax=Monilinia fructigena TaxID=38457 RepID=A0A395IXP3_9HELO|nr:hypothetical protein DID88_001687 [Monilinia fructigena]
MPIKVYLQLHLLGIIWDVSDLIRHLGREDQLRIFQYYRQELHKRKANEKLGKQGKVKDGMECCLIGHKVMHLRGNTSTSHDTVDAGLMASRKSTRDKRLGASIRNRPPFPARAVSDVMITSRPNQLQRASSLSLRSKGTQIERQHVTQRDVPTTAFGSEGELAKSTEIMGGEFDQMMVVADDVAEVDRARQDAGGPEELLQWQNWQLFMLNTTLILTMETYMMSDCIWGLLYYAYGRWLDALDLDYVNAHDTMSWDIHYGYSLLIDKETAAASFNDWWNALPPNTVTIFSDGSESYDDAGKHVGYGYAIYQGQALVATGKGAINTLSHVFDAEAIGALKGLQKALTLPSNADTQRWLCIDSTSVIWCKRANASDTSQWAFLESHRLIDRHAVNIRWSPGHQGITGNEAADSLADAGAKSDIVDPGPTAQPTISGIGSIARSLAHNVTSGWWRKNEPTLSGGVSQMATRLRFEGAYGTQTL